MGGKRILLARGTSEQNRSGRASGARDGVGPGRGQDGHYMERGTLQGQDALATSRAGWACYVGVWVRL